MATVVYINVYNSHVDRGATVSRVPFEHYEVDEDEIKVGERLPKFKCGSPIVKAYDGQQLLLELYGETITIKVGEEVEVTSYSHEVGMGVYSRTYYYVKLIGTELIYIGGWQWGETIRQELAGPIGNGEVHYPNGDRFKGTFHLSYAHINGPAYAAEGRYEFADGSWIDHAWIHTSEERKPDSWGLHGVYRIHHPDGPDSITMFLHGGKRYGFEFFFPEKSWMNPRVEEWYAGDSVVRYSGPDELFRYKVDDYEIDETSREGCTTLRLTLRDGDKVYRIEQQGGRYEANQYDNYIYEPYTHVTVHLPNGDILDHYGDDVRDFKPYDGYVNVYCAKKGMSRREHWEQGKLTDNQEWKRDVRAATQVTLPDPTGVETELEANVWADGHIVYGYDEWVYDGEVKNNRPDGQGVLVGDRRHGERRYEGTFKDGVYVSEEAPFEGKVMLHVKCRENSRPWEEYDREAKLGILGIVGFFSYEITSIRQDCVTIDYYDKHYEVRPGQPLKLYNEIEGREWSDGCVYDSDEYWLELTWKE